jgi:hypothetical protein
MKNFKRIAIFLILISIVISTSSCINDDKLSADISINEGPDGDIGGDFVGNGGSTSETFNWQNSLTTADYNADITASTNGSFQMIVKDSGGKTVLDRSLNGNVEPDTFSGVTSAGAAGTWTVTIIITNFNGDGSFTLSEGD